jgi:predicted nucleic acid-binding protein
VGRCYVDTNVWIAVAQSRPETAERALAVLDDPHREIVLSDLVRLEALPKPRFHGRQSEVDALEALFVEQPPAAEALGNTAAGGLLTHPLSHSSGRGSSR